MALALVAKPTPTESVSLTLGAFTTDFDGTAAGPDITMTVKQRASVYGMGWPGINADVRAGLSGVPSRREVGVEALLITLGDFTADFDGTFQGLERNGSVALTLAGFEASFEAEHYYSHFFDVTYGIVPTWVASELPARAGDVELTLDAFTVSAVGNVLPPDAIDGQFSLAVASFTLDFDGEFTAPASVAGSIGLDIEVFGVALNGSSVPPDSSVGSFALTLAAFSVDFDGTAAAPVFDGDVVLTMGAYTASFRGQYIDASANNGVFEVSLADFAVDFTGSAVSEIGTIGKFIRPASPGRPLRVKSGKPIRPKRG